MPRSRIRRRRDFTPPSSSTPRPRKIGNSRWVAPTMVTLLLVGLFWVVTYYLAGSRIPVMQDLGGYNLLIGIGLITGGFLVSTRWK